MVDNAAVAAPVKDADTGKDVFFEDGKLTLSSGVIIEIPKLTWKSESKAIKILGRIMNSVPEMKTLDLTSIQGGDLLSLLPPLFESVPDALTDLVSVILKRDKQFIEEEMTAEDLVLVLVPFSKRLTSMLSRLTAKLPAGTLEATTTKSPKSLTSSQVNTDGQ